ncbi:MAG: hypothetical protein NC432_04435 [Roseburia sp.]|nr:hypothetical protein [Roseburia sp.]MCM1097009.1 hypothetical protein [Ruminococcus flavefaciens]
MTNGIRESMEGIRASEELKRDTLKAVEERRKKLERRKNYVSSFQTIDRMRAKAGGRHPVPRLALAACLLLFLTVGSYSLYERPTVYLSIDVNPSVELEINRFGRVVSAKGYNEDGKGVLGQLSLNNLPYLQAVERLLEKEENSGYLGADSQLFFTVIAKEPDAILARLESGEAWGAYEALIYTSDETCREAAHEHEMSFGKYRAYLELAEYDGSVTVEDCHGMTMGEIQERIDGCKGHGDGTGGSGHGDGSGHGGHHGH